MLGLEQEISRSIKEKAGLISHFELSRIIHAFVICQETLKATDIIKGLFQMTCDPGFYRVAENKRAERHHFDIGLYCLMFWCHALNHKCCQISEFLTKTNPIFTEVVNMISHTHIDATSRKVFNRSNSPHYGAIKDIHINQIYESLLFIIELQSAKLSADLLAQMISTKEKLDQHQFILQK